MKWFLALLIILSGTTALVYLLPNSKYADLPSQVVEQIFPTPTPIPPPAIADLATQASMTAQAKNIFFGARPLIDTDRTIFNHHCQTPVTNNTIELGCYTPENRIYLWNISDPQLHSEMVSTAAHEMLHAAYAKLSISQRQAIDKELEANVTVLKDSSLTRELAGYEQTEPGQRDNELHSIIGTEYPLLSPKLETYYRQYFVNRQTVVADAQQFDQVFASYKQQIDDLHHQLMVMKRQMTLNQENGHIQSYNAQVPRYNELVNQYNQLANEYNQLSRDLTQGEDLATTE